MFQVSLSLRPGLPPPLSEGDLRTDWPFKSPGDSEWAGLKEEGLPRLCSCVLSLLGKLPVAQRKTSLDPFSFFPFFFFYIGITWEFPGWGPNQICSCRPTPGIRAACQILNTLSGTGTKPTSPWTLVGLVTAEPQGELLDLLSFCVSKCLTAPSSPAPITPTPTHLCCSGRGEPL